MILYQNYQLIFNNIQYSISSKESINATCHVRFVTVLARKFIVSFIDSGKWWGIPD